MNMQIQKNRGTRSVLANTLLYNQLHTYILSKAGTGVGGNNNFPPSHSHVARWEAVLSNAAQAESIVDTAQPKDGSLEAASEMVDG